MLALVMAIRGFWIRPKENVLLSFVFMFSNGDVILTRASVSTDTRLPRFSLSVAFPHPHDELCVCEFGKICRSCRDHVTALCDNTSPILNTCLITGPIKKERDFSSVFISRIPSFTVIWRLHLYRDSLKGSYVVW